MFSFLLFYSVVSNDWPTALVAPYGNGICYRDDFDGHFKKTKFFHIIHNVEKGYDGELFFDDVQDTQSIHNVPREIIQYGDNSINLSKTQSLFCSLHSLYSYK